MKLLGHILPLLIGYHVPDDNEHWLSWTTIVVHNRDRPEIFQNSLIERMPKAAFRAINLSIKHSRPFPSDLKTDQEVLKAREAD